MDKDYIRKYGKLEKENWWFIVRQKIILQILSQYLPTCKNSRLQVLNVGVAGGASSKWLSKFGDVVSVENDPLFIEYLHSQNIPVVESSITGLPFKDSSFDLVCAFDVIEHVDEDRVAVDELWRVCKPGGNVCITVPAFQSLWGVHDVVNRHKRRYTKQSLKRLIGETNADGILYSSYFNFLLFLPIFIFRKLNRLLKAKKQTNESDFHYFNSNGIINHLLKFIFGIELYLLKWIKFPLGVSLLLLACKQGTTSEKPH